jgi:hypothetical protein
MQPLALARLATPATHVELATQVSTLPPENPPKVFCAFFHPSLFYVCMYVCMYECKAMKTFASSIGMVCFKCVHRVCEKVVVPNLL